MPSQQNLNVVTDMIVTNNKPKVIKLRFYNNTSEINVSLCVID